jgi:hypothetical protein
MSDLYKYEVRSGTRLSEEYGHLCIRDQAGWLLWSTHISNLQGHGIYLTQVLTDSFSKERKLPPNPRREDPRKEPEPTIVAEGRLCGYPECGCVGACRR